MNTAIRAGFRAKYYRVNDLLLEYAESASNTTLRTSKKKQLNRYHLLMIDEFGLGGLTADQRADVSGTCRLVIPFWTDSFIELGA